MTEWGLHRDRNFLIYLLGNTISWLGTWAQRIGIGWLSWDLTHRSGWVGVVSLAQLLPLIFFGPLFGTLLDRHDHRRYVLGVNVALSVLAFALYVLTARHLMRIELLCVMAMLLGIANSAYQAVRLAIVNDIVAAENLAAAIAVNSVLFNVTRAVGPAIAGVVIAKFGVASAFGVNALSFMGILAALSIVRFRPRLTKSTRDSIAAESIEGLRYVLRQRELRQLLLLSGVTSIFGRGIVELFPVYADLTFHRGVAGLANMTTVFGAGAICAALVLSRTPPGRPLTVITRGATAALGGVICVFGLCTGFRLALMVTGLLGFLIVLCSVGLQVRVQTTVAELYRGRVLGLWIAVNVAAPGLGGALAGAAAQRWGLGAVTVVSGLLCVALVSAARACHK